MPNDTTHAFLTLLQQFEALAKGKARLEIKVEELTAQLLDSRKENADLAVRVLNGRRQVAELAELAERSDLP